MDELNSVTSPHSLTPLFHKKSHQNTLFSHLLQSPQLLPTLTSYLTIPQILNLSMSSKQLKQTIQKRSNIQNRILKAHLQYLMEKEDEKVREDWKVGGFFGRGSVGNSAYLVFQGYWDGLGVGVEERLERMRHGKINMTNSPLLKILHLRQQLLKTKKLTNSQSKQPNPKSIKPQPHPQNQTPPPPQPTTPTTTTQIQVPSFQTLIKQDKQYEKLQQWEKQAAIIKFNQKLKKYNMMTTQERRQYVLAKMKEVAPVYLQMGDRQECLIQRRETFWDRLKKGFRKEQAN